MQTSYNPETQRIFLEFILSESDLYPRIQNIFNWHNFESVWPTPSRNPAKFIQEHVTNHSALPDFAQVNAVCGTKLQKLEEMHDGHKSWFFEEFEKFTRQVELTRAILRSTDLLEEDNFNDIEKLIKDAVQISLTRDMGTDYFSDPRSRLMKLKESNGQVSTGWPLLDASLYGGMNRGELNVFCGCSGAGKSLFLQNISRNWLASGLNGVYITHELSEELVSMRLDSMISGITSREIFKKLDDVEVKVAMAGKKYGKLHIKYLPAQSNVNDIRAYIRELQVQQDFRCDFIAHDYIDLLTPAGQKISATDMFVKDKLVCEELRNMAKELNVLMVSASQLNRSAVEETEYDHSNIAGGISKINTADNVFGIFITRAMRDRGEYELQLLKTRSSSGVGNKVPLAFNVDTLLISGIDESELSSTASGSDALKNLRAGGMGTEKVREAVPTVNKAKLDDLLAKMQKKS